MRKLTTFIIGILTALFIPSAWAVYANISGIAAITAGGFHTCALTSAGGVKCWGDNSYGALGDGSTTRHLTPVAVTGLASGVTAIAAGWLHTCALTTAGGVKCWGDNYDGQLGDNSTTTRLTPVAVTGLASGVIAIAVGGSSGHSHTCALTTAGGVKCWGYNGNGQLGDNSTTDHLTPVAVTGLASAATAIAAGHSHTCALTTAGGVKCWGYNALGQLGDNSGTDRLTAVAVTGLASGVTAITAGGFHTCALTTAGGVTCWGYNYDGELGDNSVTNRWTPVAVTDLASAMTAVSGGSFHTCALTAAGGVKCWGNNFEGELGDSSTTKRLTPVAVTGLASGVAAIAVGNAHTCARTTAGGVKCWGWNAFGQLGDNSTADGLTPVNVLELATEGTTLISFSTGWNLVGNGVDAPITVSSTFSDSSKVVSVWKWVATGTNPGVNYPNWAFYSPAQGDAGQAYAASKGYDVLSSINAGEGFWLNAQTAFTVTLPSGAAVQASSFKPTAGATAGGSHALRHGWSLIATGDSSTPAQFDAAIATLLSPTPVAGQVYTNLTSLWAWSNTQQKWYFWAPSLVNSGGLTSYLASRDYLDFANLPNTPTGSLSPTTGFWVNLP